MTETLDMAETIVAAILALAATWAIAHLVVHGISSINYGVDDECVRIRVGRLRVRGIPIRDIHRAEIGVSHWVESWGNTLDRRTLREKAVTLYRRSGLFRKVCLTPDEPRDFVDRIKRHPHYTGSPS